MNSENLPDRLLHGQKTRETGKTVAIFQSLHPGTYWRAKVPIEETYIEKDDVLLIREIKYVDDISHTVTLHPHPLSGWDAGCNQHNFLVSDFLARFEYEPDGLAIREREMREAQGDITKLQQELVDLQTKPTLLLGSISPNETLNEEDFRRRNNDEEEEEEKLHFDQTAGLPPKDMETASARDVISGLSGTGNLKKDLPRLKQQTTNKGIIAKAQANLITTKVEEIEKAIRRLSPFFAEKGAAALAACQNTLDMAQNILRGLGTLDLYIGNGVKVETICKGAPADPSEPLMLFQRKLFMDEEYIVHRAYEGADIKDLKGFIKELSKKGSLLNRILPSQRGIVALAYCRRSRNYSEDAFVNSLLNAQNKKAFLIVRNGENVYRILAPLELEDTKRLFPTVDEMDAAFRGIDGQTIPLNNVHYADARKKHDDKAYHYKRLLVLLCGLQDRERLFGDFTGEELTRGSLLDKQLQERCFKFVYDDERNLLGEGKPSYRDWLKSKNQTLRSGSRVACLWDKVINIDTAPFVVKESPFRGSSSHDHWVYEPTEEYSIVTAYKDNDTLKVDAQVKNSNTKRSVKAGVTLLDFSNNDSVIPNGCLVLDTVSIEELDYYINSRIDRTDYMEYIWMFMAAREMIEADLPKEQLITTKIKEALVEGGISEITSRVSFLIREAIRSWRAAHRGACIPEEKEKAKFDKIYHELLDHVYVLVGAGRNRVAAAEFLMRDEKRSPLRLSVTGTNKLLLYAAPIDQDIEKIRGLFKPVWVQRIVLEELKTKVSITQRSWVILPEVDATETVIHEWPKAKDWAGLKSPKNVKYDDLMKLKDKIDRNIENLNRMVNMPDASMFEKMFLDFTIETRKLSTKYISHPNTFIPIAFTVRVEEKFNPHRFFDEKPDERSERRRQQKEAVRKLPQAINVICAKFDQPSHLYSAATKKEQKEMIEKFMFSLYKYKDSAIGHLKGSETKFGFCGVGMYPLQHVIGDIGMTRIHAQRYHEDTMGKLKESLADVRREEWGIPYFPNEKEVVAIIDGLGKTKEGNEENEE